MICPKCGTENPNELIFCKNCGENLAQNSNMGQQSFNQNSTENYNNPQNQVNPYGNQTNPYGNQNNPYGNQANPYGNQSNPYGNQYNPYGNPYNNFNQNPPVEYAGFWRRVAAYILDSLIVGIPMQIIGTIIGVSNYSFASYSSMMGSSSVASTAASGASMMFSLINFVVILLYFALMESSNYQATLGKMILGIKVTDLYGQKITFGRAIGRYLGKILSGITICIGFAMAGFTEKKQALHDMVASTLVVMK